MKISIGSKIIDGPWGGGNLFVKNFKNYLEDKNHEVINHLLDDDIDVILFTDLERKDYHLQHLMIKILLSIKIY